MFSLGICCSNRISVVEETCRLLDEDDIELVAGIEDSTIVLTASWCCDVLDARASGPVDIVDEWELHNRSAEPSSTLGGCTHKSVAGDDYAFQFRKP